MRPILLSVLLIACNDGATDTAPTDTAPAAADTADTGDTAPADDTGPGDTGDTSPPDDTSPDDTGETGDTGPPRLEGELALGDAAAILWGEEAGEGAGWAVAGVGDVDGDGRADFMAGAHRNNGAGLNSGVAYLVSGALADGSLGLADAGARLMGAPGDYAGGAVSPGGDLDGDGALDVLVGATGIFTYSPDPQEGVGPGLAYLFPAVTAGAMGASDALRILGEADNDRAGSAVAGGFDLTGDGLDDALVGATQHAQTGDHTGAAYLIEGPIAGDVALADAALELNGEVEGDQAGAAFAVGDFDGDGHDDALVSADGDELGRPGVVYLLLGPLGAGDTLAGADATLTGEANDDVAGSQLAARDVDGDGLADALIDAYELDDPTENAGGAYLFYGSFSGAISLADADARFTGVSGEQHGAESAALVGDLDDDGYGDLLLGAHTHGDNENDGRAYLFYGPHSGDLSMETPELMFTNAARGDQAGWAVGGPGDVTGDGIDDALVTASAGSVNAPAQGAVYLIAGQ